MSAASETPGQAEDAYLTSDAEVAPAEEFALALLQIAISRGASDVFITDDADGVVIQTREMGRIRELKRLSRAYGNRLQNRLRTLTGADIADPFTPAEGHHLVRFPEGQEIEVRLSAMPTVHGHDIALRLFEHSGRLMQLDDLGMFEFELERLIRMLQNPGGLVLVGGPTGSGKTTTLYACLRYLGKLQRRIHTLEEPVEYFLPGIVQSQVNARTGLDYSELLHACLRHSPDVIMIGELRDEETAEIAVRAANSGQLVLVTVHAQSTIGALQSLLAYDAHPHFVAASLVGVIAQRLVRRLCPVCREREASPGDAQRFAGIEDMLPEGKTPEVYHPRGCNACRGEGFDRLTCVPEILIADRELRQGVADQQSAARLDAIALEQGMVPLCDAARLRIATGQTTPDEIRRVLPGCVD